MVDSISERLRIDGFRMGDDENADSDANEIWQRNFLDADSSAAQGGTAPEPDYSPQAIAERVRDMTPY